MESIIICILILINLGNENYNKYVYINTAIMEMFKCLYIYLEKETN